jgi:hypothetical protein
MNTKIKKPISVYCKQQMDGWQRLSDDFINAIYPLNTEYTCGFVRLEDGIQMMASIKCFNGISTIHVTLAPIRDYRPDWTDEEHVGHIFDIASKLISSFFPDRKFAQQPNDPRNLKAKHYFSILD